MNNLAIQLKEPSPNINPRQSNASVYSSAVFVQQYKQLQTGLKEIKIQDQNLQHNIQVQKQRLLKNIKFSKTHQSTDTKFHVRSNRVNNIYTRESMIVNKSRIIHSSSINKSQVYDQKLIQTIQELQKIVEMHRHNQKGYKIQIQSLMEQITYMKSIIQQRQTLIAKHTRQIQVIRQNGNCNQCSHLRQQIHTLHERYRHEIQRITQSIHTNQTVVIQRRIKEFQSIITQKNTIISKLQHQLKAFTDKTQKSGQRQLKQKLITMELQITKLSQILSKRDKQKGEYEERIRQLSYKYDSFIMSTKSKQEEFLRINKSNHQLKVQIQILQSEIERLNSQPKSNVGQNTLIFKKIQKQKYQLEQLIITLRSQNSLLTNRVQRMKNEGQQRIKYIETKQIQERTRQKRIEQLSITVRQRDTQIFNLREEMRKMRKQSTQKGRTDVQIQIRIKELTEQNRRLNLQIHRYQTMYQQIKIKYEETQHTINNYQFKIQNYSRLEIQIQALRKQNYQLSQNKYPPIQLGGNNSRKIIEIEQQNIKIKQELAQLRRQIGDRDIMTKWIKYQQQVQILLSEIERLKNQPQGNSKGNQNIRIHQLQGIIFNLQTEIQRLKTFESRFYQYQQRIIFIQSRESSQLIRLENQIRILQAQIQRLNILLNKRVESPVKPKQNHDQCQNQIRILEIQINRLNILINQKINSPIKQNHDGCQNQIRILKAQINRLTIQLNHRIESPVKQNHQKCQNQIRILEAEINRLNILLNQRVQSPVKQKQNHDQCQNQIRILQAQIHRLNITLNQKIASPVKETHIECQNQIRILQVQINRLNILLNQRIQPPVKQNHQNCQNRIRILETQLNRLTIQINQRVELPQVKQNHDGCQNQIRILEAQINRLNIIINQRINPPVKQNHDECQNEIRFLEAQIHRLNIIINQRVEVPIKQNHIQCNNRVRVLEIQLQRLNTILNQKVEISVKQSHDDCQRQISRLRLQIDRLIVIERNFYQYQKRIHYLQNNPIKQIMKQNHDECQRQISRLRLQIDRLVIIERKFYECQKRIHYLQNNPIKQIMKQNHDECQKQISRLRFQIDRLVIIERNFYEYQKRIHYLQDNPIKQVIKQNHDECQRQIQRLRFQINRLAIIERNFYEYQKRIHYLQSNPIKQVVKQIVIQVDKQAEKRLLESQNQLIILQRQIDKLRVFQSRYIQIQKYQKLEERFQIIERLINQVLRIYKIPSCDYNLQSYSNIPHYLSELVSIFINLHKRTFEMNALIQSFETQILELKRINIEIQQNQYRGGNLTIDIQALQNKIQQLKNSNQFYIRMNNTLTAKLQTSEMQRQFIFNQFVTAKGQLQKLQHETIIRNTITTHSTNASIDIEQLRSRIHQIESVTALSMDKMRQYYQQIQNDIDFQLGDMRNTVNLLQENNIGTQSNNVDKYKKIVLKLQMQVNQLQNSYKTFQATVSSNIKNTNQQIIQITDVMNQRIKNVIQQRRKDNNVYQDKSRLQIQLQNASKYIESLISEKEQLSVKINDLRVQFDTMRQETKKINLSYSQAISKSEALRRQKEQMEIIIQQIADQKAQIERQLITKINHQGHQNEAQQEINFLGNKLRQAQGFILHLESQRQQFQIRENIINELNLKYQASLLEKNIIEQNLISIQIKVQKLEEQKLRLEQNNKYLHNRCQQLEGQIHLLNQRLIRQNGSDQNKLLQKVTQERQQVINKLAQAETHIAHITAQINALAIENQRLKQACSRLEIVEIEYQNALQEKSTIQKTLIEVQETLNLVRQQKHRVQVQFTQIKSDYVNFTKSIQEKHSQSGKINSVIQQIQGKLNQARQNIKKQEQQKLHLVKNIQTLNKVTERTVQLQNSLAELKVQNNRILLEKNQKESLLTTLESQLKNIQQQKSTLEAGNVQLRNRYHQLQIKVQTLDHVNNSHSISFQFEAVKNKLIEAQQYIYGIQTDNNKLIQELQNISKENSALIEAEKNFQQTIQEHRFLVQENHRLQSNIQQLQFKLHGLNNQKQILVSDNFELRKKFEQLQKTFNTGSTQIQSDNGQTFIRSTIQVYPPDFERQSQALFDVTQKLKQAQRHIFNIQQERNIIIGDVNQLAEQNNNLLSKIAMLQETIKTQKEEKGYQNPLSYQAELNHLQNLTRGLENEKLIIIKENKQLKDKYQQLEEELYKISSQTLNAQTQSEELFLREQQLKTVSAKLSQAHQYMIVLEKAKETLTQDNISLADQKERLTKEQQYLNQKIKQLNVEISQLRAGNQNLKIDNDQFKNNNINLSAKLEKFMMTMNSNENDEQIRNLKQANKQLIRQNQNLRIITEKLEETNRQIKTNLENLKLSKTNIQTNQQIVIKNYQQQISICKEQIQRQRHYIDTVENDNRSLFDTHQQLVHKNQQLTLRINKIQHPTIQVNKVDPQALNQLAQDNRELNAQVQTIKNANFNIVQFLNRFNNYINSFEGPTEIPQQVFDQYIFNQVPAVQNICQNVLYRLKNSFNQQIQKQKKITELKLRVQEAQNNQNINSAIENRYQQVVSALVQQQTLNQGYQKQIINLQEQIRRQKIKLQEFTNNDNHEQCNRFLQESVEQINILENNCQVLSQELNNIISHQRYLQQNLVIMPQKIAELKQLEENLMKNQQQIRQQQQQDKRNINYVRQVIQRQSPDLGTKFKLNQYLDKLQKNIKERVHSDSSQISSPQTNNKRSSPKAKLGHLRSDSKSGDIDLEKDDLQRQLKELSDHIQIYHKQWNRRRQVCLQMTIAALNESQKVSKQFENLNEEIPQIKFKYPQLIERVSQINKILVALSNQLQAEQGMKDQYNSNSQFMNIRQDFILSPNFMHIIQSDRSRGQPTDQQFYYALNNLKNSISNQIPSKISVSLGVQTQNDPKPLIDFLLRSSNLSSVDLVALKQKVASIRAKQRNQNTQIIKENINKIQQIIQRENTTTLNRNSMDYVINTMISSYSPSRLHSLFKHSSNKEIANAMNEASLSNIQEMGEYRLQNSGQMMNQIQQRKMKFYQNPTRISQDVHAAILKLISAKNDEQFLRFIEQLFETIYIIQQRFQAIIKKKDDQYREHTIKMNQIFNRSQSQSSEQFDGLLQESGDKRLSGQGNYRFSYGSNNNQPRRS